MIESLRESLAPALAIELASAAQSERSAESFDDALSRAAVRDGGDSKSDALDAHGNAPGGSVADASSRPSRPDDDARSRSEESEDDSFSVAVGDANGGAARSAEASAEKPQRSPVEASTESDAEDGEVSAVGRRRKSGANRSSRGGRHDGANNAIGIAELADGADAESQAHDSANNSQKDATVGELPGSQAIKSKTTGRRPEPITIQAEKEAVDATQLATALDADNSQQATDDVTESRPATGNRPAGSQRRRTVESPSVATGAEANKPLVDAGLTPNESTSGQTSTTESERTGDATSAGARRDDAVPSADDKQTPHRLAPQPVTGNERSAAAGRWSAPVGGRGPAGGGEVDRVRFVERVARAFRSIGPDGGDMRLRLSPPSLGAAQLEVSVRSGVLAARMEVETVAAKQLLLENMPALRERLAQHDIKIARFDVDLMGSGGGSQHAAEQHPEGRGERFLPRAARLGHEVVSTATKNAPARPRAINGVIDVIV